jgi:DNA-directed RNA polymerase specialized sigma24 family protein
VDPIVQLAKTWRQGYAGQRLAAQLRSWAASEPALRRFDGDPNRVFRFLRTPPSAERDDVFCALLRCAKHDQLAGLVVLEALLPGLKASLGRTLVAAGENDELLSLMLANAWQQITSYPVERRPQRVAANLLLDIRTQTLKQLTRHRPGPALPLSGREPSRGSQADIERPLRRAVATGALSEEEAELILLTRVDGQSLRQLADERGLAYQTLLMRRIRAERRLWLFLGRRVVSFRGRNRHMCTARTDAADAAD